MAAPITAKKTIILQPVVKKTPKKVSEPIKNAPESKKTAKEMLYDRLAAKCTSKVATLSRDKKDEGYSLTIEMGKKREEIQYFRTNNHKHSIRIVNNLKGRGAKAKAAGIEQIHVINTFKDIDYWVRKGSRETFSAEADSKTLKKAAQSTLKSAKAPVKDTAVSFKTFPVTVIGEGTLKGSEKTGICIAKSSKITTIEFPPKGKMDVALPTDFFTATGKQTKPNTNQSWKIRK